MAEPVVWGPRSEAGVEVTWLSWGMTDLLLLSASRTLDGKSFTQDPEVTASSLVTRSSVGVTADIQRGEGSHSLSGTTGSLGKLLLS